MARQGSYTITADDQIVSITFSGSWTADIALKMTTKAMETASSICTRPWGCLLDLRHWELGTPEVWGYLETFDFWCIENNLSHSAVVCINNVQKVLIARSQSKFSPVTRKEFTDLEGARKWLGEKGLGRNLDKPQHAQ